MSSFLQSPEWLAIAREQGKKIIASNETCNWVERSIPLVGNYWYGGHIVADTAIARAALSQAREQKMVFVRITPFDTATLDAFRHAGARPVAVKDEQPSTSLLLDLQRTVEQLKAQMKPKTRYNIGLALRHGVRVEMHEEPLSDALFAAVWELYEDTAARHKIRNHPREHYRSMRGVWVLAWHEQDLLAAHFCFGSAETLYYVYGASSVRKKALMAPYLTQWETIVWAKERGYKHYDFWGIAPNLEDVAHPYYGITRFKLGFGGAIVQYPGTFEIPLDGWRYFLYRVLKKARSLLRR